MAAARAALRTGSENGDGIGAATADLLTALAAGRRWGRGGGNGGERRRTGSTAPPARPMATLSELGPVAGELRVLARSLLSARGRAGRGAVGGVALAVALAALVAEIAAWQAARGRDHQAAAAGRSRDGRHRARPRAPARGTAGPGAGGGWGERPGTGHATAARRVGAVPPPAEQRARHDPTDRDPTDRDLSASVHGAQPGATRFGVVGFGAGLSADAVGGSAVTDRQEQAVLAVVRLIGDQDVEVTAQHASSTSAAVTVRIGRALLYLNDQATAGHFHKVWFDAAAHARTLPPVGHPAHRGLVRALRGMPEPGIVANATARPPCSVAMVGGDPPDAKPFLRIQLGRVAFEIRDFAAYRSCLGAFRQAHHMARDVFLPAGSARVYNGALTAARDAFYPHTPDAPDPPASHRARHGGAGSRRRPNAAHPSPPPPRDTPRQARPASHRRDHR